MDRSGERECVLALEGAAVPDQITGERQITGQRLTSLQSGASSSAMADFAAMVNVGLSYLVTLGNEAMITAGHLLDFLVDDPGTKAIDAVVTWTKGHS